MGGNAYENQIGWIYFRSPILSGTCNERSENVMTREIPKSSVLWRDIIKMDFLYIGSGDVSVACSVLARSPEEPVTLVKKINCV